MRVTLSSRTKAAAAVWLVVAAAAAASRPSLRAANGEQHGIDLAGMDRSVTPGDDFFRYANGTWLAETEIPADRSRWGVFSVLDDIAVQRSRQLLERAASDGGDPGSIERKVGDFYASVLDEAAIEARGSEVIQPALARVRAIGDRKALARVLGEDLRTDVDPLNNTDFQTDRLFGLWVAPDFNNPTRNAAYLLQGGLDLPDREYYVTDSPKMAEIRSAFLTHVEHVLSLAGEARAAERAPAIVALEGKIARTHATRLESLQVTHANNPWATSEFAARAPGLDWNTFFEAAGLAGLDQIIVWHPAAITGLSALVASEPLDAWKDWLIFHAVDRRSDVLPAAFVEERFAFHLRTLAGVPAQSERWRRAVAATSNGTLGEAVGRLYVREYFPPETKTRLQALVTAITAAFRRRIDRLDWMSPGTKSKALEKVSTLYVGLGYPERWSYDYSGLEVVRGDALGNVERGSRFAYAHDLAKLKSPVDRTEWAMTPQTVNAVNLPLQNALNFPAAILEAPFFDPAAPDAVNYAAIGSVIGHEISHSFDDQGALFDPSGRLANWWTKEDFAHFTAAATQLAAQYDAYEPFPGVHVNGRLTLSENIADLAGLSATYDAWKASPASASTPVVGGFTGEQQFFLSFAQIWRTKTREAALRQLVLTNGHSPDEYRVSTVRNLDPWYAAFGVERGQRLFLAPDDRVRVW
jgi:putative endopeptidase